MKNILNLNLFWLIIIGLGVNSVYSKTEINSSIKDQNNMPIPINRIHKNNLNSIKKNVNGQISTSQLVFYSSNKNLFYLPTDCKKVVETPALKKNNNYNFIENKSYSVWDDEVRVWQAALIFLLILAILGMIILIIAFLNAIFNG